jgi:hypothetical protein
MTEGSIVVSKDNSEVPARDIVLNGEPVVKTINGLKFTITNMSYRDKKAYNPTIMECMPDNLFSTLIDEGLDSIEDATDQQKAKIGSMLEGSTEKALKLADYKIDTCIKYCTNVNTPTKDYKFEEVVNHVQDCIDELFEEILALCGLKREEQEAL